MKSWSAWHRFPDPATGGILHAPIGPGCYELRNTTTDQLVLFGMSKAVAARMTSLLPAPNGVGGRRNDKKRAYVREHRGVVEYRTLACASRDEAEEVEERMKRSGKGYLFEK